MNAAIKCSFINLLLAAFTLPFIFNPSVEPQKLHLDPGSGGGAEEVHLVGFHPPVCATRLYLVFHSLISTSVPPPSPSKEVLAQMELLSPLI